MKNNGRNCYHFEDFCLDTGKRVLTRVGEVVPLTPKAFETLLVLVKRRGFAVGKEELLAEVWPDAFVEEATLAQNVFTLRKALGRTRDDHQYIQTVPKYGYRFVPAVTEVSLSEADLIEQTLVSQGLEHYDSPHSNGPGSLDGIEGSPTDHRSGAEVGALSDADTLKSPVLRPIDTPQRLSRRARIWAGGTLLLLASLTTAIVLVWTYSASDSITVNNKSLRFSTITNIGTLRRAAISPDGKVVAYVQLDGGLQSLWVRQVFSASSIQLVTPMEVNYQGLSFAPDSNSIFSVVVGNDAQHGGLYQTPVLGGVRRQILTGIDSNITFSPDARRIAFIVNDRETGENNLMVANVDGSGMRKLTTLGSQIQPPGDGPAWSPDGQVIACAVRLGDWNRRNVSLVSVRVDSGAQQKITTHQWNSIGQVSWLPSGRGVIMDAWDQSTSSLSSQIWQVSYPGGHANPITHDLNTYSGISITQNAKTLASVVTARIAHFWVAPAGAPEKATQITSGLGDKRGEKLGVSWTFDGRLVYGSSAGDSVEVWVMNSDGSNKKQLTSEGHLDMKPVVSPDGPIIFVSRRTGFPALWKMNSDGENHIQLTSHNATFPDVSPDGQWVVYTSFDANTVSLWKISSSGGESIKLSDKPAVKASISPDGKQIACFYQEDLSSSARLVIIPFAGGPPIKAFDLSPNTFADAGIEWTPDGHALVYVVNEGALSNLWIQRLDGAPPSRLTNFSEGRILRFAWSPDGQQIAFERGFDSTDAVLINGLDELII